MDLAERWDRFWFAPASLVRLATWRIVVIALASLDFIGYARTALDDAAARAAGTSMKVWTPIYLLEALGLDPPGERALAAIVAATAVALAAALIGWRTRVACALAALGVLFVTAVVYSYGKVHHDKVAFAFAIGSLPLARCGERVSVDAWLAARRGAAPRDVAPGAALPLRLTQITLAIGYSFAGWTKLAWCGLDWANGYTLMRYLMQYDNVWSRFLSHHVELTAALSLGALLLQATFALVFVVPRLRWIYLPGAVAFHVMTWLAMDTGPYITCWLLLASFLPLERAPAWLAGEFVSRSAWRFARLAWIGLPLGAAAWVVWRSLPASALVALAGLSWFVWPRWLALSRRASA